MGHIMGFLHHLPLTCSTDFLYCCLVQALALPKHHPIPSGPTPLPVIDNLHQSAGLHWQYFMKGHRQHGPLISFLVGHRAVIIIGSNEVPVICWRNGVSCIALVPGSFLLSSVLHTVCPCRSPHTANSRRSIVEFDSSMSNQYRHFQDIESKQVLHDILI